MGSFIHQLGSTNWIKGKWDLGNIRDKVTAVARHHLFILRGMNSELCLNTEMPRDGGIKAQLHQNQASAAKFLLFSFLEIPSLSLSTLRCCYCDTGLKKTKKNRIQRNYVWSWNWIHVQSLYLGQNKDLGQISDFKRLKNPTNEIFTQKPHQNNGNETQNLLSQQNLHILWSFTSFSIFLGREWRLEGDATQKSTPDPRGDAPWLWRCRDEV